MQTRRSPKMRLHKWEEEEKAMDSCQSPFTMKNISWPLLPCCRLWNNDSLCGHPVEFQMGVRNEVIQSVGKGQVHADSLSRSLCLHFFYPSSTLRPLPPGSWGNQDKGCNLCCYSCPHLNIQLETLTHFPASNEVTCCNLIWPANSTIMSRTTSDNSGKEVPGGHYLRKFPFAVAVWLRKRSC